MKLLIAHDGSPYADAVLNDLPRAGLAGANDALVLSVADVIYGPTTCSVARRSARQ
jgi:hypothetical protein